MSWINFLARRRTPVLAVKRPQVSFPFRGMLLGDLRSMFDGVTDPRRAEEVQVELAKSCALCFLPDQITSISNFNNFYALEPIYDQVNIEGFTVNIDGATVYMKRRIQLIVNACKARERGCGDTDMYIAAALAQNGSAFTIYSMRESQLRTLPLRDQTDHVKLDWVTWFKKDSKGGDNTSKELSRFSRAIKVLESKNWSVPYIDMTTVNNLINRSFPQ